MAKKFKRHNSQQGWCRIYSTLAGNWTFEVRAGNNVTIQYVNPPFFETRSEAVNAARILQGIFIARPVRDWK